MIVPCVGRILFCSRPFQQLGRLGALILFIGTLLDLQNLLLLAQTPDAPKIENLTRNLGLGHHRCRQNSS